MDKAPEWLHEKEHEKAARTDNPQPLGNMTQSGEADVQTSTPPVQIFKHLQVGICFHPQELLLEDKPLPFPMKEVEGTNS